MIKTLLLIILIVFAVSGICEFIYALRLLFFRPKKPFKNYILIFLSDKYALKQLMFIWQKILWHGDNFGSGIVAITDDIDTKEILQCQEFAKGKNILLCEFNKLSKQLLQGEN